MLRTLTRETQVIVSFMTIVTWIAGLPANAALEDESQNA